MATAPVTTSGTAAPAPVKVTPPVSNAPVQTYARIVNDKVVEVIKTASDITKQFDTKSQVWVNCTSTPGVAQGWLYENNVFTAPSAASAAQLTAASAAQATAAYKAKAKQALQKSDATMLRVQEAISLGQTAATAADVVAWVHYRRALRTIAAASDPDTTVPLPAAPAFPAGT